MQSILCSDLEHLGLECRGLLSAVTGVPLVAWSSVSCWPNVSIIPDCGPWVALCWWTVSPPSATLVAHARLPQLVSLVARCQPDTFILERAGLLWLYVSPACNWMRTISGPQVIKVWSVCPWLHFTEWAWRIKDQSRISDQTGDKTLNICLII